jgi:hypothetical protein
MYDVLFCSVDKNAEAVVALLLDMPGKIIIRHPQESGGKPALLNGAVRNIVSAKIKSFEAKLLSAPIIEANRKKAPAVSALLKLNTCHHIRRVFNNNRADFGTDMQLVAAFSIMLDTGSEKIYNLFVNDGGAIKKPVAFLIDLYFTLPVGTRLRHHML